MGVPVDHIDNSGRQKWSLRYTITRHIFLFVIDAAQPMRVVQYTQTVTGRQSGLQSVTDHDGSSPFVSLQET